MPSPQSSGLPVTKLRPPPQEPFYLARPQLHERLCTVRHHRLAMVIGPTGAGKTTLLAGACREFSQAGELIAWLTLDRRERIPRHFLDHLVVAIQQTRPAIGRDARAMLQGSTAAPETVVGSLINDLTEAATPLTLFLDDFQEAETPDVCSLLIYFLRYLPATIHVVVASQRSFPLSLSWARARHWIVEIGWDDLRLTQDEMYAYLTERRGLALSNSELGEIAAQTEGWACALQMAAVALSQQAATLPGLSGWDFADALLEDLFARLPERTRRFLLDTSILERLSPSLCDAVTGDRDSRQRLSELTKTYFLVQPLDHDAPWLRYHHLFGSFLRKRLHADDPARVRHLHDRAGEWCAANGYIQEALHHWLLAEAYPQAARLLIEHGQTLLRKAEIPELADWLRRLPPAEIAASPELSTLNAWCELHAGRPFAILAALDSAARAAPASRQDLSVHLRNEWALLRALASITGFDWLERDVVESDLPGAFGDERPVQRAFAHVVIGYAERHAGDLVAAWSAYRVASDLADTDSLHSVSFISRFGLAVVDLLGGRPESALAGLQAWFADGRRRAHWQTGGAAFLRTAQALALADLDRLDEAVAALDEAINLTESCGAFGFLGVALTHRARLHAIDGRLAAAWADLDRARVGALPAKMGRVLFRADLCEAWIRLRRGELPTAGHLLSQAMDWLVDTGQGGGENVEAWNLVRCQWLLADQRWADALALATAAEYAARNAGRVRSVVECLLIRAVALQHDAAGGALALGCFRHAQQLARAGNLRLPFRLLTPDLSAFPTQNASEPEESTSIALPGALHQREAQIVRLLDQGLRNREIAARLFLSEETVKWYLKRMYDNFDAANRVQLLAKIRRLGLLGDSSP